MEEFVKEGFLSIISFFAFILIVLIIIGQSERRRKGESFIIKKENNIKRENEEGCLTSLFNGIESLIVLIIMILFALIFIWFLLKAISFH